MLKAIGKYIDTLPLMRLFSQEERYADTVIIEVDRYHDDYDLSHFRFMMRGITESGGETESILLIEEAQEKVLHLKWRVSPKFTAEGGMLSLDLFAYLYDEEANVQTSPPNVLVRYQLPPVLVRPLPDSKFKLESASYTAFLLEVRSTAETALAEMRAVRDNFTLPPGLEARLAAAEGAVSLLTSMADSHETRILALEQADGGMPIVVLSQSEYDALTDPDEGTLYVVRDDPEET